MVSAMRKAGVLVAAVVLALVAALCSVAPALADEAPSYAKTVTFDNVATGDTVNAYKLFSYTDEYHGYEVNASFKSYLKDADGTVAWASALPESGSLSDLTDNQLADWFSGVNSTSADNVRLILKGYINQWGDKKPDVVASIKKDSDSANPSYSFEPGYYLVLPATTGENSSLYNPVSVFVKVEGSKSIVYAGGNDLGNSLTVQMKSTQGPEINKFVKRVNGDLKKTQTVQVGETVTYAPQGYFPRLHCCGQALLHAS